MFPERYAHSIAALGFPGARRAFQIGPEGGIYAGDVALDWRLDGADDAVEISPVYFERDAVPVAHWWHRRPDVELHFEAVAAPLPSLGDTSLVLSVRVTASRAAADGGPLELVTFVRQRPEGPHSVPWDALPVGAATLDPDGSVVRDGRLAAWLGAAGAAGAAASRREIAGAAADRGDRPPSGEGRSPADPLRVVDRLDLAPGGTQTWQIIVPLYPTDVAVESLRRDVHHDRLLDAMRDLWRGWLAEAMQLETPDVRVNTAYRAALVTLIQCQERIGADWFPIGSPFQYRDIWIRDGARVIRALAVAGLSARARDNAWSLRRYQLPPGAFVSQRGQLDGTGQVLWAFEQAAWLPPDPATARRLLPAARAGWLWIESQRAATRAAGLPWAGLLPYAEPRDNERVRAQLVGSDAWAIAGYRSVARLARLAGDTDLELAVRSTLDDYRETFAMALARSGRRDVPASWQGPGRDWGNIVVGYPTLALPPSAPRLDALADRLWEGGASLVSYASPDSLHTYLGTDLAQRMLLTGRAAPARAYLDDLLRSSSSTLGQAEIFSRLDGGFGINLPPHATAAALLVDLLRNMLVCDVRDTLEIALGADASSWDGTHLTAAPTRFGVIDLALERRADGALRAAWTPVPAPARVRVPDGWDASSVVEASVHRLDDRWVLCDPGTAVVTIHCREAEASR